MMVTNYWRKTSNVAPLVVFRIVFGLMIGLSILRFWSKGWIPELYIEPDFFFSYYGFEWVKPIGQYTYLVFAVCFISAIMVMLGWFYRIASVLLFLSFTWIELMDKTTYLNHYYFVSLISFLMIFLPANVYFSIDSKRKPEIKAGYTPAFTIDVLKVMMGILYCCAGLAKLNSDWLLEAQPLRIWLPARNDLPLIGPILGHTWTAYLFSWFGCFYDLTIVFWLVWKKTRWVAYLTVVVFHVLTAILFPIGMFPFVMMACTLIFFSDRMHTKILGALSIFFQNRKQEDWPSCTFAYRKKEGLWLKSMLSLFLALQLLVPFRYLLYPGELLWTEEGYRFSWRVMLMEKNGYTVFTLKDPSTGQKLVINNTDYLTRLQEKQMSFQPDMILEFAHHLARVYEKKGWKDPVVLAESYATLNGRPSQLLIDSTTNLAKEKDSFKHKKWILPLDDTIKGF